MDRLINRLGNLIIYAAIVSSLYLFVWYGIGFLLKKEIETAMAESTDNNLVFSGKLHGPVHFPLQFRYHFVGEILTPYVKLETGSLRLTSWFVPGNKIALDAPYGLRMIFPNDKTVTLDRAHVAAAFSAYPDSFTHAGMEKWQKEGETITISRFFLKSGEIFLKATGEIHLDENLQPYTKIGMSVSGHRELLERLVAEDAIPRENADLALTVLKLLERPDETGRTWVTAPLETQNGAAYLGPLRLGDLPTIQWHDDSNL